MHGKIASPHFKSRNSFLKIEKMKVFLLERSVVSAIWEKETTYIYMHGIMTRFVLI